MIILFPLEIKVREYLPKLILINELLKIKNITIFLFRGRSFLKIIKKMQNVIFFDKSLSETKKRFHKNILKKNYILSLDEEGPIYNWDLLTRKARLPSQIICNLSKIFLWGKYEKKFISQKQKILVTGHPKYDLLKYKYINKIFFKEINFIKKNFRKFVFVSSSFTQDVEGGYENYIRYLEKAYKGNLRKKYFNQFLKFQKNDNQNYLELINLTIKLAKNYPNKTIIFRPHPSQDINIVKSRFPNLKNLKIIRQFQISPWIYLCDVYVHSHCTTSYEAAILKKKIITLIKNKNTEHKYNLLKFRLGEYFTSSDKCIEFFKLKKRLKKYHLPKNYILNNNNNTYASKIIKNFIEKEFKNIKSEIIFDTKRLKTAKNKQSNLRLVMSNVKNYLLKNDHLRKVDNFLNLPADWFLNRNYKKNKFTNFKLNEIKKFFNLFSNNKQINRYKIKKISNEIIQFKN